MVIWLMTSTSLSTSQSASGDPWPAPLPAGNVCTHWTVSECTSRGLTGRFVYRSKRHKSGSMEEEADSPGEYYHSPSPAGSSRNWTEDMEGGNRPGGNGKRWVSVPAAEAASPTLLCGAPGFMAAVSSQDRQEKQVLQNTSQLNTKKTPLGVFLSH